MLTVTGAPKLATVTGEVEILIVVEADGTVDTLLNILLTSASAASF